ncbi:MAG TPA: NAD(+)/NADH kinase [Actinomycetota bacterium]|nr:NAD(+)/NADH kinase [Actinomycetota bacterium]
MKFGFVVHGGRPAAIEAASRLVAWCRDQRISTRCLKAVDVGADELAEAERFPDGLDLVVSFGGDGTLLRAALQANRADVPLLGVNVGRLGFLTEATPEEAPAVLESFLEGNIEVQERLALIAEAEGAPWDEPQWALNEVIVEKTARHRLVTLAAMVGDDFVTTFSADGVIVATPTGSTAYSFSARGPIVSPRLQCLILTPVSAHMVFDRPLVLAPDEQVVLEVKGEEPGLLSADGRPGLELPIGSRVRIRRADRPARLLRRKDAETFYSLLRRKFDLPTAHPGGSGGV